MIASAIDSRPPHAGALAAAGPPAPPADEGQHIASALNEGVSQAAAVRKTPPAAANLWAVLGVPWGVGVALLLAQWSVLRGVARSR